MNSLSIMLYHNIRLNFMLQISHDMNIFCHLLVKVETNVNKLDSLRCTRFLNSVLRGNLNTLYIKMALNENQLDSNRTCLS